MTPFYLPTSSLPSDPTERDHVLSAYFGERVPECRARGTEWQIELRPFPDADYYVDPRLVEGLKWWQPNARIEDIPFASRDMGTWFLSLNDAWTLSHWSRWLARTDPLEEVTIFHVDDHDDLMSPRIAVDADGYSDLWSGAAVNIRDRDSIDAAIRNGSIGQGSFLVPLICAVPKVHLRHLCATDYAKNRGGYHEMKNVKVADELLSPGSLRPAVELDSGDHQPGSRDYLVSSDPWELVTTVPRDHPVLLHIDLDYFNNRFNGDSDYAIIDNNHDTSTDEIRQMMEVMLAALSTLERQVVSVAVAISPGFFPAEHWERTTSQLGETLSSLCRSTG